MVEVVGVVEVEIIEVVGVEIDVLVGVEVVEVGLGPLDMFIKLVAKVVIGVGCFDCDMNI